MSDQTQQVSRAIKMIVDLSLDKAHEVLSKLIGVPTKISLKSLELIDITDATSRINASDQEVMGVFVDLVGDAPFSFFASVETEKALTLTDLFLRKPKGTSKEVNEYVKGMVQEMGNILATSICNVFARSFKIDLKPSPPDTARDYLSSLFGEFISRNQADSDEIMLINCKFEIENEDIKCNLYLYPHQGTQKKLSFLAGAV